MYKIVWGLVASLVWSLMFSIFSAMSRGRDVAFWINIYRGEMRKEVYAESFFKRAYSQQCLLKGTLCKQIYFLPRRHQDTKVRKENITAL